jgi:hypothetical protein
VARPFELPFIDSRVRLFFGEVQGDGVEGPGLELDGGVADRRHERGEIAGTEEAGDGCGEIFVGGGIAGEQATDTREDFGEIPAVCVAKKTVGRLSELEDGDGGAGFEDAMNFAEASLVVGEVAEAESGGDGVEGVAGEGEAEGVGFKERDRSDFGGGGLVSRFFFGADEHGMSEIGAQDAGWGVASEREGEVASATAEVEDESVGPIEDGAKAASDACAPESVELHGEDVVEQVVARGDLREHFADFAAGLGFVRGALGSRAGGGSSARNGRKFCIGGHLFFGRGRFVREEFRPVA